VAFLLLTTAHSRRERHVVAGFESPVVSPANTRCVTVAEAADRLGIGITLAKQMAVDGRLPSIKLGNRRVVPVAVLERMVSQAVLRIPGESPR
jgi:excisionase family DNA binding protein